MHGELQTPLHGIVLSILEERVAIPYPLANLATALGIRKCSSVQDLVTHCEGGQMLRHQDPETPLAPPGPRLPPAEFRPRSR